MAGAGFDVDVAGVVVEVVVVGAGAPAVLGAVTAAANPGVNITYEPAPPVNERGTSKTAVARPVRILRTSERRVEGAK